MDRTVNHSFSGLLDVSKRIFMSLAVDKYTNIRYYGYWTRHAVSNGVVHLLCYAKKEFSGEYMTEYSIRIGTKSQKTFHLNSIKNTMYNKSTNPKVRTSDYKFP